MFQSLIPTLLKIAQNYIYFKRLQNGSYLKTLIQYRISQNQVLNQNCTRVPKDFWQIVLQIHNPITPLSSNSVLKCTLNVNCTTMQNFVQWWKPFQLKINCFSLFDLIVVDKIKTTTIRLMISMVNY